MILKDPLYGSFKIKEKVLLDLLKSQPVQRLKGVSQQGFPKRETKTDFPIFTRYEHSVGVMLLLRRLNASVEEQVAGLIHDVSHTAFSHVIDWAVGDPSKESYQDEALEGYIKGSQLASILAKHSYDVDRISNLEKESRFGLLERKIPDLCADRIDYSLREGYYWDGMDADYCVRHLVVNRGEIVFDSRRAAKVFGANYMKCQKEYWAGNEAKLRYYFIGLALREALNNRVLQMQDMYKAESEVIAKLRRSKRKSIVDNINKGLSRLKFSESRRGGINLLKKLRYVDPKFIHKGKIYRLSEVDANYRSTIEKEKKRVSKATRVTLVE